MRKIIFGIVFELLEIVSGSRPVILSRQQQGVIMQVFNTGSADPGAALVRATADTSTRAVGGDSLFVRVRFSREIMPPNEYH